MYNYIYVLLHICTATTIQLQLCSITFKYNFINVQLQIMYMPRGLIDKPVHEIKKQEVYS